MKKILVICVVLFLMGCVRMSLHEEAYRAGRISYGAWQAWEQQQRDFHAGKGRFPHGSQTEFDTIQRMLMEPVPVRVVR